MKIRFLKIFLFFCLILILSCNESRFEQKKPEETETMNSGKLKVYCDESLKQLLQEPFAMYAKNYPNVKLDYEYNSARATMSALLSGNARVAIISRDYLKDEDSLMAQFKVKKHIKFKFAEDGLTFFAVKSTNIDTLNDNILKDYFYGKNLVYSKYNFYILDQNSSEYANFNNIVLKGYKTNKVKIVKSQADLNEKLSKDKFGIGISYLSIIIKDTSNFKMLPVGFNDTSNKYIFPHVVHQANILRSLYPYPIKHWVYILEDRQNLPYWFASYLSKEAKVQKYFLDMGLVPAFAQIKLMTDE